jgi:hypothetical protein
MDRDEPGALLTGKLLGGRPNSPADTGPRLS